MFISLLIEIERWLINQEYHDDENIDLSLGFISCGYGSLWKYDSE